MDGLISNIPEWWLLVLAIVALLVTMVLAAAESALQRIGRTALTELQVADSPRAQAVEQLAENRQQPLTGLALSRVLAEMTTAVSLTLVVADLLPVALTIAVVAFAEGISVAKAIGRKTREVVDADQERRIRPDLGGHVPKLEDGPWPAFPADVMSIAIVAATQCEGMVLIHEKMFESRLFFVDKLIGMGARIVLCDPHRAVISGPAKLRGGKVESPDIRAGMAMLIAALERVASMLGNEDKDAAAILDSTAVIASSEPAGA